VTNVIDQLPQMNLLVHRFEGMQHMGLGAYFNLSAQIRLGWGIRILFGWLG